MPTYGAIQLPFSFRHTLRYAVDADTLITDTPPPFMRRYDALIRAHNTLDTAITLSAPLPPIHIYYAAIGYDSYLLLRQLRYVEPLRATRHRYMILRWRHEHTLRHADDILSAITRAIVTFSHYAMPGWRR